MSDELNELMEELDLLQGTPKRRSLTNTDDLSKVTNLGPSLTDMNEADLDKTVKELESHLDSMLGSIHDYRGFLSRTRSNI